jgi:hypothetical protein
MTEPRTPEQFYEELVIHLAGRPLVLDELVHYMRKYADQQVAQELARVAQWRGWAQFVYKNGGTPDGSDVELQAAVCEAHDRATAEAVQAERDRCAKLCVDLGTHWHAHAARWGTTQSPADTMRTCGDGMFQVAQQIRQGPSEARS